MLPPDGCVGVSVALWLHVRPWCGLWADLRVGRLRLGELDPEPAHDVCLGVFEVPESIGERCLWVDSLVKYLRGIPRLGRWVFTILCVLAVVFAFGTEYKDDAKSSSGSAEACEEEAVRPPEVEHAEALGRMVHRTWGFGRTLKVHAANRAGCPKGDVPASGEAASPQSMEKPTSPAAVPRCVCRGGVPAGDRWRASRQDDDDRSRECRKCGPQDEESRSYARAGLPRVGGAVRGHRRDDLEPALPRTLQGDGRAGVLGGGVLVGHDPRAVWAKLPERA